MSRLITRRSFVGGLLAAAAGGATYTRWCEPRWLEVTNRRIDLSRTGAARPLRVVQLSDFHASAIVPLDYIAEAVALAVAQRPDLVLVTGDFITKRFNSLDRYARVLRPLAAAAPAFACAGNHDGGPWVHRFGGYEDLEPVGRMLAAAGLRLLQNEWAEVTLLGARWQLIGTGDLWSGECRPDHAFARLPRRASAARLVLCHNPDAKSLLEAHDWDLMCCGHTHGGQIRLPLLGTPFAPVRDKRFVEGLHVWRGRWLNVNRGVGNLYGLRFNCRPEISVLELV